MIILLFLLKKTFQKIQFEKQKVNLNNPKTKRNSLNMILINIDKQKLLNGK